MSQIRIGRTATKTSRYFSDAPCVDDQKEKGFIQRFKIHTKLRVSNAKEQTSIQTAAQWGII